VRLSPGIRAMIVSALAFAIMSAGVKMAGERLPSVEIAIVRGVVTLVLSYWALRRAGISPWGHDNRWLFVRGLLGFGGLHCYFYAVTALPLAEATVIHFTNPLFVAIAAPFVLGEKLGRAEIAGVVLGFAGVVLVAQPAFLFGGPGVTLSPLGVGVGLMGAVFGACAYMVVRKLRTEHPLVVVFHFPLLVVPLTLPLVIPVWVTPTAYEWLLLVGIGIVTQVGQVKMTEGIHLEPAARATAASYVQIIFSFALGFALFDDVPTPLTWLGAVLIAAGTLVVATQRAAAIPTKVESEPAT
jgi:drug/metabolite transporter (DMT)-like permease